MTNMDQEQRDTVGYAAPTGVQPMRDITITAITNTGKDASVLASAEQPAVDVQVKLVQASPKSTRPATPVVAVAQPQSTTPSPPGTPSTTQPTMTTQRVSTPTPTSTTTPSVPLQMALPKHNEKIKLHEVNPYLTCRLCKGYLIDATTISECLHSFCRSCIIRFLQDNSHCPECEVVINKTKPNLKLDKTLQDIVYKLVPELYLNEMTRRRQFYASRPPAAKAHLSPEQRGEDTERIVFNARDKFSLCLEYISDDSAPGAIQHHLGSNESTAKDVATIINNNTLPNCNVEMENNMRRYLQCPGMCRIDVLKKFVRNKYNVDTNNFHIDILYKRVPLPEHYTLIDVAYIYSWKRNEPMKFFFRITDIQQVRDRFDFYDKDTTLERVDIPPTTPTPTPVAVPLESIVLPIVKDKADKPEVKVKVKVQTPKNEEKVKKLKTVRFHSDVKFPLANSTPKVKSEKHVNGLVGRPKSPPKPKFAQKLSGHEPIDVNSDEWLREQVRRVAKEMKKCKKKEAKDTKDNHDSKHTIKEAKDGNTKSVNGVSISVKPNGHVQSDKLSATDTKVMKSVSEAAKASSEKVDIKPTQLRVDPHIITSKSAPQDTKPLDLVTRSCSKSPSPKSPALKSPSSEDVKKEEFLRLVNLQAKNSLLKPQPKPLPVPIEMLSQRKSQCFSPSRKSPKPESPKASKSGHKRKHSSSPIPDVLHLTNSKNGHNGLKDRDKEIDKVKKPKFSIKPSTKHLKISSAKVSKLPKTPKTPKTPKDTAKVTVPPPPTSPLTITPMSPKPVAAPLPPPVKPVPKPAKQPAPTEMNVDLEEPNLKNLLNTCKIPSSLSITCVNGDATDRESQIKPVINHIEILKLPEVREVPSPDSSKLDKLDKPESRKEEPKSISKEKLEKVGTTIKLQSAQEVVKKEEKEVKTKPQSELSITITMEKEKEEVKSTTMSSPGDGVHGMGIHPNLPKILQPTPTGRNINSFQKMFEETVRKRNDMSTCYQITKVKTKDSEKANKPVPLRISDEKNSNSKRNILEIASQLSKKSKLEQETKEQEAVVSPGQESMKTNAQGKIAIPRNPKCDTLSNLHSNTLALNYSVSINQQKPAQKSPSGERENVVSSTTPVSNQFAKLPGAPMKPRIKITPKNPQLRVPNAKTSPKTIAPKEKHRASPPVITSPKVGIPMPTLSPLSQGNSPQGNQRASPSNSKTNAQTPAFDVNQLQEKYNLQNLAQLSASFNFPAAYGQHQHQQQQAMAAIQQAMLMNCMQQTRPWFNMPPAIMAQYENVLKSFSAAQTAAATAAAAPSPAQNLVTKDN